MAPTGGSRTAIVEDVIFNDNLAAGFEVRNEFADQRSVVFKAFAMDDVGKKNDVVAPRDRVFPIVAGD